MRIETETYGLDNLFSLHIIERCTALKSDNWVAAREGIRGAADELEARRAECERLEALLEAKNDLVLLLDDLLKTEEAECERLEAENARLEHLVEERLPGHEKRLVAIEKATFRLRELEAENVRLREALRPFASIAHWYRVDGIAPERIVRIDAMKQCGNYHYAHQVSEFYAAAEALGGDAS